ncbi:Com family DNA-binding transcriptional regulator [Caenispirillum bisanense]|uniref:Com family DNA-binding transcriptional regulator n=1 Tax=Caenispirillum bisanense TaxID=414052 RepID=UPI000BE433F0
MESIRCGRCARLLARATEFTALEIKCPRCGTINHRAASPSPERHGAPSERGTHGKTSVPPSAGRRRHHPPTDD